MRKVAVVMILPAASTSEAPAEAEAEAAAAVWETPGIGAVVYAPPGAAVPEVMM